MSETVKDINWKGYTIISIIIMIGIILAAIFTRLWVITAIPIGFLFGFFLKKGELCGASAMSETFDARPKVLRAAREDVAQQFVDAVAHLCSWSCIPCHERWPLRSGASAINRTGSWGSCPCAGCGARVIDNRRIEAR